MPRVLIVEDTAAHAKLVAVLLRHAGHEVFIATSALAGIAIARAERPDLIVMDVRMPEMDGLQATAKLKADAATSHIPILALTVMSTVEDERLALEAGCSAYLSKPQGYVAFYEAVDTLLGRQAVP